MTSSEQESRHSEVIPASTASTLERLRDTQILSDPMPQMPIDLDWETVKDFLMRQAPRLL